MSDRGICVNDEKGEASFGQVVAHRQTSLAPANHESV